MFALEKDLIQKGYCLIAGVDEVGRGCLAGPMVFGAVILDLRNSDISSGLYSEINDSKLISEKKRNELSKFIKENAISYSIEAIENETIDRLGISMCTQIGFFNAITKLARKPDFILSDAFRIKRLPQQVQMNVKHGDRLSVSIAAASIVAKVFRDGMMREFHALAEDLSVYGFDRHKGYGTKSHIEALKKFGASSIHRKSFKPVKSLMFPA